MIIVKTKNGDHFINDQAVIEVKHDREKAVVSCYGANGYYSHHEDVEAIVYTNEAQPMKWENDGLEIERLKAELKKKKRENHNMYEHFGFIREWFFIYQKAFYGIKNVCERAEHDHPDICKKLVTIIEEAEKKYAESQERFENVREKWDKKEK